MRLCLNRSGKLYDNGRYYPKLLREQVLDMIHSGISQRTTATELKTSRYFVKNVLAGYDRTGCSLPHMKVQPALEKSYNSRRYGLHRNRKTYEAEYLFSRVTRSSIT